MTIRPAPRIGASLALAATLVAGPFAATSVAATPPEAAAAVLAWNLNANDAIVSVGRQPPHVALLHFAMVQGAVYDAVNAIDGGYEAYLSKPQAAATDSKPAAVAA